MKNVYLPILISFFLLLSFQVSFSQNTEEKSKLRLRDSLSSNTKSVSIDSLPDKTRKSKTLGSIISKEQLQDSPEIDINRVINNKISGLEVKSTNGLTGSANRIWIRGMSSLYGDNNVLFIVDGVPITNTTKQFDIWVEHLMSPTRSIDINPNNIESIKVLKSLAETNIYGSEGRNGVIIINTKTGQETNNANLTSNPQINFTISNFSIDIATLPDYQDKFGQGFDQQFGWFDANWGPGFYKDGLGGWAGQNGFDEDGTLPHPYSTSSYLEFKYPEYQEQFEGMRYEWKPRNSVNEFFNIGNNINASFNILAASKNKKHKIGFDLDYLKEEGFTPHNDLKRCNLSFGNSSQIAKNFKFNSSLHFVRTKMRTPQNFSRGFSSIPEYHMPLFEALFTTPRNIDFFELPYELPDGSNIYYRGSNEIDHPLWTLNNSGFSQLNNRFYGDITLQYDLNERIDIQYCTSIDTFLENNTHYLNKGSTSWSTSNGRNGFYETYENRNKMIKHDIKFYYHINKKTIIYNLLFGAENKTNDVTQMGDRSNNQEVYGYLSHTNFLYHTEIDISKKKNIYGLYGQFSIDYKDFLSFNVSGRNDFVANEVNNSVFMPSVSVSFVPTAYFEKLKDNKILNYIKLRSSYGTSANYDKAYLSNIMNNSSYNENTNLLPEHLSEIEYGLASKLFGFAHIDLIFYKRKVKNLLIPHVELVNNEYYSTIKNVGEVNFNGLELDLQLDIFKNKKSFNWNSNMNFTKTDSEVIDIGENDIIYYSRYIGVNGAKVGYPLGAFFGLRIARNEDNIPIVYSDSSYRGHYIMEYEEEGLRPYIGDPNPDFIVNYSNKFSYKNFSLGFLINHRVGGDIDSFTISTLLGRGLTTDTVERLSTFVLPGVSQETGETNTIQISNSDFYFGNILAFSPYTELSIYDASVIRLQEVSLGYELSSKNLKKAFIKNVSLRLIGYNLWFNAYNIPKGINYDPNVSSATYGNSNGFDSFSGPSSKKIGFSLGFTF